MVFLWTGLLVFWAALSGVEAHSSLAFPVEGLRSRKQIIKAHQSPTPCKGPAPAAGATLNTYARGQTVPYAWYRNNHNGGFVQLAIAPVAESGNQTIFDNNVFHYNCFQTTCPSQKANDPLGGDNGAPAWTVSCNSTFTVPTWLADGLGEALS
jgi:hypothetical protein